MEKFSPPKSLFDSNESNENVQMSEVTDDKEGMISEIQKSYHDFHLNNWSNFAMQDPVNKKLFYIFL